MTAPDAPDTRGAVTLSGSRALYAAAFERAAALGKTLAGYLDGLIRADLRAAGVVPPPPLAPKRRTRKRGATLVTALSRARATLPRVTPISPALLTLLRTDYTAAPAPHAGALAHGTELSWLAIVSGAWALTSSQTLGYTCGAATLRELQAATPATDGSGTFVSVIDDAQVRRVLTLTTGGAICADEPPNPPPP